MSVGFAGVIQSKETWVRKPSSRIERKRAGPRASFSLDDFQHVSFSLDIASSDIEGRRVTSSSS
jgi:hypothetical protein